MIIVIKHNRVRKHSEWFRMVSNGFRWFQMVSNGREQFRNGLEWSRMEDSHQTTSSTVCQDDILLWMQIARRYSHLNRISPIRRERVKRLPAEIPDWILFDCIPWAEFIRSRSYGPLIRHCNVSIYSRLNAIHNLHAKHMIRQALLSCRCLEKRSSLTASMIGLHMLIMRCFWREGFKSSACCRTSARRVHGGSQSSQIRLTRF